MKSAGPRGSSCSATYALVVAELAAAFLEDLSWSGAATFAGLLTTMWLAWAGTILYANRFDADDFVLSLAAIRRC